HTCFTPSLTTMPKRRRAEAFPEETSTREDDLLEREAQIWQAFKDEHVESAWPPLDATAHLQSQSSTSSLPFPVNTDSWRSSKTKIPVRTVHPVQNSCLTRFQNIAAAC